MSIYSDHACFRSRTFIGKQRLIRTKESPYFVLDLGHSLVNKDTIEYLNNVDEVLDLGHSLVNKDILADDNSTIVVLDLGHSLVNKDESRLRLLRLMVLDLGHSLVNKDSMCRMSTE